MGELATVVVEAHGDIQLVRLAGEVDISNASKLAGEIAEAVPNGASGVALDLSDTRYLDSAGIRMLFELAERLDGRRQTFVVVVPPESLIRHALSVTGVERAIDFRDSVVEGLDWLRSAAGSAE